MSAECLNVQGFDENMMAMLKQQYPARLMPQLVQSSQATLQVSLNVQSPLAGSFLAGQQSKTKLQLLVSRLCCYASFSIPTLGLLYAMLTSLPAISCACCVQCEVFVVCCEDT